jgi:Cdc6-like AAA superfamily ATPase
MKSIVLDRLNLLAEKYPSLKEFFPSKVLDRCAKLVSANGGDLRNMLEICRICLHNKYI